jgi:hypothetical protein
MSGFRAATMVLGAFARARGFDGTAQRITRVCEQDNGRAEIFAYNGRARRR